MSPGQPVIELFVHEAHSLPEGFELSQVLQAAERAMKPVLELARADAPLTGLDEVEVTLVDDKVIGEVHQEFMDIPGATDVITFDHGEIVVSTETAASQGAENGNSIERETALYVVHGLLHLAGYADKSESEFAEMARLQAEVLDQVWPQR